MADIRTGVCPKCLSTEVYTNIEDADFNIAVRIDWKSHVVPAVFMCASCGYLEQYVLDPQQRESAAKRWTRADGRKQKDDDEKRKNDER